MNKAQRSMETQTPPTTARRVAPWLTFGLGLVLFVAGLPVAIVAFSRLMSVSWFGPQVVALITGNERGSGGFLIAAIVLAVAAATAAFGAMMGLTSLFVLTRRGTRRAVAGTRVATQVVRDHELTGRVRVTIDTGGKVVEEHGRQLGASLKARYLDAAKQVRELQQPDRHHSGGDHGDDEK